ncbi:hypothetical protein PENTCL1PPCAC_11994, partial [Pristionchus entomophagus]
NDSKGVRMSAVQGETTLDDWRNQKKHTLDASSVIVSKSKKYIEFLSVNGRESIVAIYEDKQTNPDVMEKAIELIEYALAPFVEWAESSDFSMLMQKKGGMKGKDQTNTRIELEKKKKHQVILTAVRSIIVSFFVFFVCMLF